MKRTFTFSKCAMLLLTAAGLALPGRYSYAQHSNDPLKKCATDEMNRKLFEQYPGLQQQSELKQQQAWEEGKRNLEANRSASTVYIIPVVFHVIHDYGTENITDAQILDQMNILNRDFRKQNADTAQIVAPFDTLAADCEIEFRLAQIDPNGNCTNGIERIASMETYVGDNGSKLNQWPRNKYLNVWIVRNIDGAAGYSTFPSMVDDFLFYLDGIVILHDYVGSIGTSSVNNSRALTHEVGHWLSLHHVWGDTQCGSVCGDDGILDTPESKGWCLNCDLVNNDICVTGVNENVQNYMEYSYCSNMFTYGQSDAMRYTLNSSVAGRNNLWTSANLAATGCLNPPVTCAPHADFDANYRMVCEGGSVTLNDWSWSSDATAWNWTLSGPTTYTSTNQNPLFTGLNTPGWYDVTLIASNSAGSDTLTRSDYIYVSSDNTTFTETYSEGFEASNVFYLGYISNNRYGNGSYFHQSYWASHSGQGAALLNNYGNTVAGDVDELITPSYYLDNVANLQFQFSYAYATAALSSDLNTQELRVYSSVDCGQTWSLRWTRTGSNLVTGGYDPNFYIPSNASHWQTITINLPPGVAAPNVRFKFAFTSPEDGTGNNLYIDDINILGSNVGMQENSEEAMFNVYPNPGDGNSTISYTLDKQSMVTAELFDVSGRLVRTIYSGEQAEGSYTMPVSDETNPLAPGTYLIQMTIGDKVSTQKYLVTTQE